MTVYRVTIVETTERVAIIDVPASLGTDRVEQDRLMDLAEDVAVEVGVGHRSLHVEVVRNARRTDARLFDTDDIERSG